MNTYVWKVWDSKISDPWILYFRRILETNFNVEEKEDTRLSNLRSKSFHLKKHNKVRVNETASYLAVVIISEVFCFILLLILQLNPKLLEGWNPVVYFLEWRYRMYLVYLLWVLNKHCLLCLNLIHKYKNLDGIFKEKIPMSKCVKPKLHIEVAK